MRKVKAIVLRTAGTNCDVETAFALKKAGAACDLIHINKLLSSEKTLHDYQILVVPGGFTYGDDIASGKILANEVKFKLKEEVAKFVKEGKLIIGICNGFQVLVKAGLLPNTAGAFGRVEASLTINDSGRFEDRWVYLKHKNECVWTKGIPDIIYLPVAHAEGKFIPQSRELLLKLDKNGQVVFSYCDKKGKAKGYPWNPNGSVQNIAGICDPSGRIFGLMPHPERYIAFTQHPRWTRIRKNTECVGLEIFRNGVKAASGL